MPKSKFWPLKLYKDKSGDPKLPKNRKRNHKVVTWKVIKGVVIRASLEDEVWVIERSDIKQVTKDTWHFNSEQTEAPDDTADKVFDDLAEADEQSFKETATGYLLAQFMKLHNVEDDDDKTPERSRSAIARQATLQSQRQVRGSRVESAGERVRARTRRSHRRRPQAHHRQVHQRQRQVRQRQVRQKRTPAAGRRKTLPPSLIRCSVPFLFIFRLIFVYLDVGRQAVGQQSTNAAARLYRRLPWRGPVVR